MLTNLSKVYSSGLNREFFPHNRDFTSHCLILSVGFVCCLVFLRGMSKIPGEYVLIVSLNK